MGGIFPIQRRLALIEFAKKNHCYIFEDDYDSEFRYEGCPISPMYDLDPDRVIYAGSFSKIFMPSVRLGFLILPESLLVNYKISKMYSDVHTDAITQYVMAEYIQAGYLEKHILKTKRIYEKRRNILITLLHDAFPHEIEIKGQAAGLHIVAQFKNIVFTEQIVQQLLERKVKIYPVSQYALRNTAKYSNDMILGYSHLSSGEITQGIEILSDILHRK